MRKEDKSTIIEQIAATVKEYGHFYLVDTTAMNAATTSMLRRECFKADIKLMVVKNTLLHKALESLEEDFSPLYGSLKGTTAVMFSNVANAPAKLIKDKAKNGIPGLKAAYAEESFYVGADQLDALVSIKSKNEVIADIVALLQSPAKNVISALQSGGNTLHGVLKTLGDAFCIGDSTSLSSGRVYLVHNTPLEFFSFNSSGVSPSSIPTPSEAYRISLYANKLRIRMALSISSGRCAVDTRPSG